MNIFCYIYKFLIEYVFAFTWFFMLNTGLNNIFVFISLVWSWKMKMENISI